MKKTKLLLRLFSVVAISSMLMCMLPTTVFANTDETIYQEDSYDVMDDSANTEMMEVHEPEKDDSNSVESNLNESEEPENENQADDEPMHEMVHMPEFNEEKIFDGSVVSIHAQEGVLTEGTTVDIVPLNYNDIQDTLDASLMNEENISIDALLYDVVLYDNDGNTIQPNGVVTVSISGISMDIPEEYNDYISYKAVRINQDGTVTSLSDSLNISQGNVVFNNDHFTPVGIVAYANRNAINELYGVSTLALIKGDWTGYSIYQEGTSYVNPVYINDNDETLIAYCFNGSRAYPGLEGQGKNKYVGKYEQVTELELKGENKDFSENGYDNVLKTINYGYPYNAGGIQEKYGLTDMEFRAVTQAAIWKYTDKMPLGNPNDYDDSFSINYYNFTYNSAVLWLTYNVEYEVTYPIMVKGTKVFNWTDNMTDAYNELIKNENYKIPEGFTLDLYQASNESYTTPDYQHLLSVKQAVYPIVNVTKVWDDKNNKDGSRPDSVIVYLYADGVKTGKFLELNQENNWSASFTDLLKYKGDKEIEYTIKEDKVDGYDSIVIGNPENGFILTNSHTPKEKVSISKTDIDGKEIEGAKLEIINQSGDVVDSWVSVSNECHVAHLEPGTYTLTETMAPKGYEIAESIVFTVNEEGKITVDNDQVDQVTMVDKYSNQTIIINKVDLDGNEIAGAKISIIDQDGSIVDEWISKENQSHEVSVQPGIYTFHEEFAPDGYTTVSDITFSVNLNGEVKVENAAGNIVESNREKLIVTDLQTEVKISKVDIANGKELEGAQMQILDKDGNLVTKWISTKEVHIVKGLKTGESYTLREIVAPKGYDITSDTTFELNADGTINTSKTTTKVKDGILLVEDSRTPTKPGTPTGADNGMNLYGSLLTVSMAGAACMLALRKKEDK